METFSMIFRLCVQSGKQRLDRAGAVGLGFGPLVFTLWASIGGLCFCYLFSTSFGVPPGPHFTGSAAEAAPPIIDY